MPPRVWLSAWAKLSRNSRQGRAAEQRAQEQSVRLQGAADLHQRAGQIIDRLQREQADRQVEAIGSAARISLHRNRLPTNFQQTPAMPGGTRPPTISPASKLPGHRGQPVGQPISRLLRPESRRRRSAAPRACRNLAVRKSKRGGRASHMGARIAAWACRKSSIFCFRRFASPAATGGRSGLLRRLLERLLPGRPALRLLRHAFRRGDGRETLCAACLAQPPAFDRARAILAYDDNSRVPILALKHADRLDLVPGFARWLERAGRDLLAETELIVPVPLHPFRLWKRRYNQAAELARALPAAPACRWNWRWSAAGPRQARAPWPLPGPAAAMCWAHSGFPIRQLVGGPQYPVGG